MNLFFLKEKKGVWNMNSHYSTQEAKAGGGIQHGEHNATWAT